MLDSPDMLLEASLQHLMSLADVLRFLHVVSAFLYVTGLIGRDVVLGGARRSDNLQGSVRCLTRRVRSTGAWWSPGSIGVMILGILTTWWAEKIPLWGQGSRWLPVCLIVFATTLPLAPIVFLPRGRVFEAALASAIEAGRVTPELTTAFRDPLVTAARWHELAVVAFVLLLMVTKPF